MEASSAEMGHAIPPFLAKCYEMVDDHATDSIISWSPNDSSFVIWDVIAFELELLPKYFKHGNFSSFIRQLNTYGFRKTNPDCWEFANDGFIKDQNHLLRNICRRKATQSTQGHGQPKQPQLKNTSVGTCVEVGKFGLREEVEMLKSDKNVLMQGLVKLRQHQESSKIKVHRLRRRIQGMEINQQQMLSLLAMAVQSPGILVPFQQQNEKNWSSKKRPLPALEQGIHDCENVVSDSQIVRYQPWTNENPTPPDNTWSNMDISQSLDPSLHGLDDLFMNIDFTIFGDGISVPMEPNLFSENDGLFILSDSPEDGVLDQLLLASPALDNIGNSKPNPLESLENGMEVESNHDASVETPQDFESQTEQKGVERGSTCNGTSVETIKTLDSLTKQMGLLASEENNMC